MTGTIHLRVTRAELPGQKRGRRGRGAPIAASPYPRHRGVEALGMTEVGAGSDGEALEAAAGQVSPARGPDPGAGGTGPRASLAPAAGAAKHDGCQTPGLEILGSNKQKVYSNDCHCKLAPEMKLESGSGAIHWFHRSQKHGLTGLKRIPRERQSAARGLGGRRSAVAPPSLHPPSGRA